MRMYLHLMKSLPRKPPHVLKSKLAMQPMRSTLDEGRVYVLNAANGVVLVPEHIKNIWALGENAINDVDGFDPATAEGEQVLYVVLYHALHTMNPRSGMESSEKTG
ncbi:hypothetical protein IANJMKHF_00308 [Klebsiella phage CPRSA]|nr:hypothetical protein IANJMKHF_00308 [Klebsiella phage CPRSA]